MKITWKQQDNLEVKYQGYLVSYNEICTNYFNLVFVDKYGQGFEKQITAKELAKWN